MHNIKRVSMYVCYSSWGRKKSARSRPVSVGTSAVCKSRYTRFDQWGRVDLQKTVPGSLFFNNFFFIPLVCCFFFQTFLFLVPVISPSTHIPTNRQYHIIPRYYTAYTVLPQRQRHFAEFDQFLTLYRVVIGVIPLLPPPWIRAQRTHWLSSVVSRSKSALGPHDATHFFNDIFLHRCDAGCHR